MNILVLNAGSSSLKFCLFRMDTLSSLAEPAEVTASGQVERIGKPDAQITFYAGGQQIPQRRTIGAESVLQAAQEILQQLLAPSTNGQPLARIDAVGHRIVHGGARYFEPTRIEADVLSGIGALTELAPLHNPAGLAGIQAARDALPGVPNVAVFDTAFHHNLPAVAARYALPVELSDRLQLRRYGFHGISYRYISERLLLCLGRPASGTRLIVCHLGNGASVCAVRDGQSVDTSMGFTPLEGLIMGNRSGDIDPGLVLYLLRGGHLTPDQVDHLLNHQSGLLGLSGRSGDVRDLEAAEKAGDGAAKVALECFAYRVRKYIGAYAAVLGGVDALVFTGGIGEHSASMRARICSDLDFLRLDIDEERNQRVVEDEPTTIGSGDDSRVWVIPTDEERQIAREVWSCLH